MFASGIPQLLAQLSKCSNFEIGSLFLFGAIEKPLAAASKVNFTFGKKHFAKVVNRKIYRLNKKNLKLTEKVKI